MAKPAGRGEAAGPELVWPGKRRPPRARPAARIDALERWGAPREPLPNRLIAGDNLDVLTALSRELAGTVDLVYLDPPFATGGDFAFSARVAGADGKPARDRSKVAYRDRWSKGLGDYLGAMRERLVLARELLSDRGTIFLHCDWHVGHLLRCLLDEVFGPECFKNEIVWRYRRWPAKTRVFQRMHDVIFWYGKHPGDHHAWTPLYEELAASTRKTWGTRRQVADFSSGRRKPSQTDEETPGAPLCDVWDIGIIAPIAHERLGYPTQKPEALLERILTAASRPGDLCADFYCGSGTTLAVAERLGRRWIGCDSGRLAIQTTRRRLLALPTRRPFVLEAARAPGKSGGAPAWSWAAGRPPREVSRAELDTRRLALGGEAPAPDPDAPAAGARVCVRSTGAGLVVALERPDGAGPRWADRIDGWAIDCTYGGGALAPRWHAQRTRRAAVPLEAPPIVDLAVPARIVVKIVDVLGGETFHVVQAPVDAPARTKARRSRLPGKTRAATAAR